MQPIIFGGEFMSQLDLAVAHCVRYCLFFNNSPCTSAVTHQMAFKFLAPCYVGDTLRLVAEIKEARKKAISGVATAYRLDQSAKEKNEAAWEKVAVAEFVFITVGELTDLQSRPRFLPYKEHELGDLEIE